MAVITIRGQLGSGAPQIGKLCAEAFSLEYMDREIISRIAKRLGRPRQQIIAKEVLPVTLRERIARLIKNDFPGSAAAGNAPADNDVPNLDDARYVKGLKSVLQRLAETEAVVIVGRGSQFFLKDYPGALHILTVAPLEIRLKRVMANFELDEETARERIHRYDTNRREFIKKYFKEDLEDPVHYDLTINTANISYEAALSIIIRAYSLKDRGLNFSSATDSQSTS